MVFFVRDSSPYICFAPPTGRVLPDAPVSTLSISSRTRILQVSARNVEVGIYASLCSAFLCSSASVTTQNDFVQVSLSDL